MPILVNLKKCVLCILEAMTYSLLITLHNLMEERFVCHLYPAVKIFLISKLI